MGVEAPPAADQPDTVSRPKNRRLLFVVIPVLIGVLIMLYPVAATLYNNYRQREFAQQYNQEMQQLPTTERDAALKAASEYNRTVGGVPILDPWLSKITRNPQSGEYQRYEQLLSRSDAMARVRVPRVGIDLPIYHGTSDAVMAKGAGHLYGTSLPVGGPGTHAVLTSHTAFATATLFDHLTDVITGDVIYIDVYGETIAYQVDQIKIVLPNEIDDLRPTAGKDYITLFTCTPYAVNSHRLLVRAHRIPYSQQQDVAVQQQAGIGLEPWMYWLLGGAALSLGVLAVIVIRDRRKRARSAS